MQQDNLGRLWPAQGLRSAFGAEGSALRLCIEADNGYVDLTEDRVLALDVSLMTLRSGLTGENSNTPLGIYLTSYVPRMSGRINDS